MMVAIEAVVLGALTFGWLAAALDRGACGDACRRATPLLGATLVACAAALFGLAVLWIVSRSGGRLDPDRIASRIGIGLFAVVSVSWLLVLMSGAGAD